MRHWGTTETLSRGVKLSDFDLPAFVALHEGEPAGLVTYHVLGSECEIVTLSSELENRGIGTALVAAVRETAAASGCGRLWLSTTNDNLHALRFYQKRCFRLAILYPDTVKHARALKLEIPEIGKDGIPIRDEIELDLSL